jgi:hypothetical protein
MERSRQATKHVVARELLMAGVLARVWPAYITEPIKPQPGFPFLLCLESPQGLLVWRLSAEEAPFFDYLPTRRNSGQKAEDKVAAMFTLAAEGWTV